MSKRISVYFVAIFMRDVFCVSLLRQLLAGTDLFVQLAAKKQNSSSSSHCILSAAMQVAFVEWHCHAQMSRSTDATYNRKRFALMLYK